MSNQVRKSAPIVKCPYCSHTGSSRGLFTHVRLSHPNIDAKPKKATKITIHPYDIKGMGHVKDTIHRIETKKKSINKDFSSEFIERFVIECIKQLTKNYNPNTLERGYKPMGTINGVGKK
jgi:hypothetical protein